MKEGDIGQKRFLTKADIDDYVRRLRESGEYSHYKVEELYVIIYGDPGKRTDISSWDLVKKKPKPGGLETPVDPKDEE